MASRKGCRKAFVQNRLCIKICLSENGEIGEICVTNHSGKFMNFITGLLYSSCSVGAPVCVRLAGRFVYLTNFKRSTLYYSR